MSAVSCGVGHRCGLDLVLLWLWQSSDPTGNLHMQQEQPSKDKEKKKNWWFLCNFNLGRWVLQTKLCQFLWLTSEPPSDYIGDRAFKEAIRVR